MTSHAQDEKITIARIERAMDVLAYWMIELGEEGKKCLPIYERLETELEQRKKTEAKMEEVFERARQLKENPNNKIIPRKAMSAASQQPQLRR